MTHLFKAKTIIILCVALFTINTHAQNKDTEYLKKVLEKLDSIKNIFYKEHSESWHPIDEYNKTSSVSLVEEYTNPQDTAVGASIVKYNITKDTVQHCYDGKVRILYYHEHKEVVVDNFSVMRAPFRLVSPFFCSIKSFINYLLTTKDSIEVITTEVDNYYIIDLTILEDVQVEFIGKQRYIPKPPFEIDPISKHKLWIDKKTNLPHKWERTMSHNSSTNTISGIEINKLKASNIDCMALIPEGYEVREYGKNYDNNNNEKTIDKQAQNWSLLDCNEKPVSSEDIKSKIILLQFTGIGCGPCHVSIPFLNQLKNKYSPEQLTIVAVETWNKKPETLKKYIEKNKIEYLFLAADNKIEEDYNAGSSVPIFIFIEDNKVVKQVTGLDEQEISQHLESMLM